MNVSLSAFVLAVATAAPPLPSLIDIATPTQAATIFGEYALAEGLLYARKTPTDPWALFEDIGLPHAGGTVLSEVKGRLTRVFGDGNVLVVADEGGRVYRYDAGLFLVDTGPQLYAWRSAWGSGALTLRTDLRAVSYARRSILNVGYVEDRFGHRLLGSNPSSLVSLFHDNGFSGLTHLYGLSQDGRRLFFADDGLTGSFNYEFDLPDAWDFEGAALSSSGSVVAVLDTRGRLWSKLLDFDWTGSNPMMFEYSYVERGTPPREDELEGFGRIHIPLPDWRELPAPPLGAGASISVEMDMITTGKGNRARALRIRGRSADGTCGLHVLDLAGETWSFQETGICPAAAFAPATKVASISRTSTLRGELTVAGKRLRATLEGYSLVDSPARLSLDDKATGRPMFRGLLHVVPAWSPLEIQDPGRDGRYKLMHVTVQADPGFERSAFAADRHLETFELTAYAASDELILKPLRDDTHMGRLTRTGSERFPTHVAAFLHGDRARRGLGAACADLQGRIARDAADLLLPLLGTPLANVVTLVTGTRFWYYHGVSMIPPLGRMTEWGTRLLYDRYQLTRFEAKLAERHCGPAGPR